jgi:hypothetical protein
MKFSLVFENSNDYIPFEVVNNANILEYFVSKATDKSCNRFSDNQNISNTVSKLLSELHTAVSLTNSVMPNLCNIRFPENTKLLEYLDQQFLNKQHEHWVLSQRQIINIDVLRFSQHKQISKIGWELHDMLPDNIRELSLAVAMQKLGFIFPYEEVNLTVHRLEHFFSQNIEFKSEKKWEVFNNPFLDNMVSSNDVVNFSFGYTYVGRQFYNKWQYWDTNLECIDHYNYETLEYAFQINLDRPQTIPYSKEFISWCNKHRVKPVSCQIPIANIVDLEKNLTYYRRMLYKNSKSGNQSKIIIN